MLIVTGELYHLRIPLLYDLIKNDYGMVDGGIEQGHESLDHKHYHFYLKNIGTNKRGFSTSSRSEKVWMFL